MKKRIVIVLVIAGIIGAGIFAKRWHRGDSAQHDGRILKIYGTIDIRDANLAFNEQERITEVLVEEGERVEAGQILARLATERLKASIAETEARVNAQQEVVKKLKTGSRPQEIAQARAEVDAALVRVANAEQILSRTAKTSGTGATSKQELDDAQTRLLVEQAQLQVREKALDLVLEGPRLEDITTAEHQLQALQASLRLLNIRVSDMTLIAPSRGIIQSRILEPGEMAGPTRPVFTLALSDPKWVRAYVPEPELGRIHIGMKAKVVSDSFPEIPVEGWIGFISPVAEFTPRTVQTEDLRTQLVYETRVFVQDSDDRLRLGMPVSVLIDKNADNDAPDVSTSQPEHTPGPGPGPGPGA